MRKCNHIHDTPFKQCPQCRGKDAEKKKLRSKSHKNRIQKSYRQSSRGHKTWVSARKRAKDKNLPFDLTVTFINNMFEMNDGYCPVLKTPITETNPLSIDRIVPALGYVQNNVRLISYRANLLKNNATIQEIELILQDALRIREIL